MISRARVVTPEAAARTAITTLVEPLESPGTGERPPCWLLRHQADAVSRARGILARFGGVLVADAVGLGKTYIGLALAELERRDGGDAVAVVPAALREEWRRAGARVGSFLRIVSHTELARAVPEAPPSCSLLLVDEAHAFRNPRTRRYDGLARLSIGRRVALLTATPVNNTPADLAHLLNLFAGRERFREFGVADVVEALRADGGSPASLALAAISVCRTRRLVEATFPELRRSFPARRLLPAALYDLEATYGGSLEAVLGDIAQAFAGPERMERGAALMRLSLIRRLESSRAALRRSLIRHRDYLAEIERAAADGVRLTRGEFRRAFPRSDEDDSQLVFWPLFAVARGAAESVASQRAALERALAVVEHLPAADPKARALHLLLSGSLAGRKVIVFTEFRDTALELWRRLRNRHRVLLVTGDGAMAGNTPVTRAEALDAFAPAARGRTATAILEADVLIATDVAGEGLNLQDASAVVNYDLPWNPVRVMQRVGRIDRLGSRHDVIQVAHLLPDVGHRSLAGVLRRLREKLEHSGRTLGAEPDPLAALWWLDRGIPSPEEIEMESWRRASAFETRERLRALVDREPAAPDGPVLAAGMCSDGEPAAVGILLTVDWQDGRSVPLPFVRAGDTPVRLDGEGFGRLAERAFHARPLPADAAFFSGALAAVLPEARRQLLALSGSRHGLSNPGAGRAAALSALRRAAAEAARDRNGTAALGAAHLALSRELPVGLDRLIGRMTREPCDPRALALRVVEVLEGAAPPAAPRLDGTPRLSLRCAIAIGAQCPGEGQPAPA